MRHITGWNLFRRKSEESKNTGELTPFQITWLDESTDGEWTVNSQTGLVDIKGDFDCSSQRIVDFQGVEFGTVSGTFDCCVNEISSLKGSPQVVKVDFVCRSNKLSNLEGSPKKVGYGFYCHENPLDSLLGATMDVGGWFKCDAFGVAGWCESRCWTIWKEQWKGAKMVLPLLSEKHLDSWFKDHPLDLDLLDQFPEIKKGVLTRTGLKDTSLVTRSIRGGII